MFRGLFEINLSRDKIYLIYFFSLLVILLHLFSNAFTNYGIFRDELYYIACSKRLAAGYVDQPPFSIYVLFIIRELIGDSLFAIRLLPALLSGFTVFFIGLIAHELGGGKTAIIISCLSVVVVPSYLSLDTIYSMNCIDVFLWSFSYYIVLKLISSNDRRLWILLGIVLGIGLLNKISTGWFAAGFFVGLLFVKQRQSFKTINPWLTALIALIIFSPFIIWNATHNFVHLEFIRNATSEKYSGLTRWDFVKGMFLDFGPLSVIVWLPGLFFFLTKKGREFKLLGIIFVITFLILFINPHTQTYYIASAFLILFPAGSFLIEQISKSHSLQYLKYAVILLLAVEVIFAPFALPLLPVEKYIAYEKAFGIGPSTSEGKKLNQLPQFYADMFGWEGMAQTVSKVYKMVPDSEKAETIVYANDYGQAGAVEYYSSKFPEPEVVCPHNNYWYWGLENIKNARNIKNIIVIGGKKEDIYKVCRNVDSAATFTNPYCMPYENNRTIYLAHGIYVSLIKVFIKNKKFI
jgi:hypothetical protein